ncbi:MAG: glycosyltransferase family 4 protein [Leptolyngbya sp. Prado105]|jgi:glycosyltransferase involved in cell wall biosynthesis|nr:glycosyltransferase family 4 protein [Leptolyngbya sp. Prado105]
MRIAYICADPGIPVFGCKGCSIHVQEVIRALLQQGHQVELFAMRWGGEPPADLAAVPCHKLPTLPSQVSQASGEPRQLGQRELTLLSLNLELRLALEQAGQFDAVYERYSLWSFTAMEYARSQGIPAVLEVNAPLIQEQATHRGLVHHQSAEAVAQRVFRAANVIVAVSQGVANYLKHYPQAQGKVQVIPNGVNCDRFAKQRVPTQPSDDFTIGFVGTMKPWHGLSTLVEAFVQFHDQFPRSRLLIVGDGPERAALAADLLDRGIHTSVQFTGKVAPTEIPGLLASTQVAVAPYPDYPDFYFSPLKVYEYMAAGLPVVASRIGELQTLIQADVNGLLYEPGNTVQLAQHLAYLYQSPALCLQLGQRARSTVLEEHTWARVAQQIVGLMQQTVSTLEVA